jgi:hypothetical protein
MSKGNVDAFLKALFHREAGGNTKIINYAGYIGKYQFGESALIDLGYYEADGTVKNDWEGHWTGKHGIHKRSDFLGSVVAQDVAAREWVELLCKRMKKMKLDAFIGQTIKGIRITESGIIAGAHLKGFGNEKNPGVAKFLRSDGVTDPEDGLKTKVSHYVDLFADYDLGCCNKLSVVFAEKATGASIPNLQVQVKKNGKPHTTASTDANGFLPALHGFSVGDQYEILVSRLTGGYKSLKSGIMKDVDATLAFLSPKAKATTTTEPHKGEPIPRKPAASATAHPAKLVTKPAPTPAAKPPAAPAKQQAPEAPLTPPSPKVAIKDVPPSSAGAGSIRQLEQSTFSITPIEPDQLDIDSAVWERLQSLEPIIEESSAAASDAPVSPAAPDLEIAPPVKPVSMNATASQTETPPASASPSSQPSSIAPPLVPVSATLVPVAAPAPQLSSAPAPTPKVPAKATSAVQIEKTRSASGHPKAVAKPTPAPKQNAHKPSMKKTIPGLLFPLEKRPKHSYKDGARFFGAGRDRGRKHAGIDLYAAVGTPVRAMADGKVIQVHSFYLGTWAIEVDHGTFIACYGEVSPKNIKVKRNDLVKRGDPLGVVGQLQGLSFSMLHLEMYSTTESPLTTALTQRTKPPFQRRNDLMDPTDSIDLATLE